MSIKVLVADDSITIQKVIGIIFKGDEYSLTVVDNGIAAVDKAREIIPDILLIDAFMPGKTGYEVSEAVRSTPSLADKPILILTSSFEPFDLDKVKKCGADDFITKPFESEQMLDKVEKLLKLGKARAPSVQLLQVQPASETVLEQVHEVFTPVWDDSSSFFAQPEPEQSSQTSAPEVMWGDLLLGDEPAADSIVDAPETPANNPMDELDDLFSKLVLEPSMSPFPESLPENSFPATPASQELDSFFAAEHLPLFEGSDADVSTDVSALEAPMPVPEEVDVPDMPAFERPDIMDVTDSDLQGFWPFQETPEASEAENINKTDGATAEATREDAPETGTHEPPSPLFSGITVDTASSLARDVPERTEKRVEIAMSNDMEARGQAIFSKKNALYAAAALLCVIAAGSYLFYDKSPHDSVSRKAENKPVLRSEPVAKKAPEKPLPGVALAPPGQSRASSAQRTTQTAPLPTFIPPAGRDVTFRFKEPGWERYVDSGYEYRLYRHEGRIGTIHVLATGKKPISANAMSAILTELTATADVTPTAREEKQAGFIISHGRAGNRADLLIYRKNGAIRGVVIALK